MYSIIITEKQGELNSYYILPRDKNYLKRDIKKGYIITNEIRFKSFWELECFIIKLQVKIIQITELNEPQEDINLLLYNDYKYGKLFNSNDPNGWEFMYKKPIKLNSWELI